MKTGRPKKWENDAERNKAWKDLQRAKSRDIGAIPDVQDPPRRRRCERRICVWLRTYMPATFSDSFSATARADIETMLRTVRHGGKMAVAWPRGGGKTSSCVGVAIFAILTGLCKFLVIVSADEGAAKQIIESIKHELEHNDLLAADYPEACFPIRKLEGMSQRCSGQTCEGIATGIKYKGDTIRLADTTAKWSKCGGARMTARGITGRIRGINAKTAEGEVIRPDLCIIDDPQTDESARSPSQIEERMNVINKAILGLAGPGKSISTFALVTVICKGDLADRLLDTKQNPQWQGKRRRLMQSLPERTDLWDKYIELRKECQANGDILGLSARSYYKKNRKDMDAGAVCNWPARKSTDDLSAIEHFNCLLADMGPEAVASEYQNSPIDASGNDIEKLTPERLGERCTSSDRGLVPADCQWLVGYCDVNKDLLSWAVVAWRRDWLGQVVDYGQVVGWWNDARTPEANIAAGLHELSKTLLDRDWMTAAGKTRKIYKLGLDSGWNSDTVYQFCYASKWSGRLQAGKGEYVAPGERMKARRDALINADGIVLDYLQQQKAQILLLRYDADAAKSFLAGRLSGAPFASGTLNFFGKPAGHRRFFESLTSETCYKLTAKGEEKQKWQTKPNRTDNHWWDCLVGAVALGKACGARLKLPSSVLKTPTIQSMATVPGKDLPDPASPKPSSAQRSPGPRSQEPIKATYLL